MPKQSVKRRATKKALSLPIVVEKDEDGYFIYCPVLDGCYTQGDTYEEAMENIQEVIELCLADDKTRGELPETTSISFCTLEVQV